MSKPISRHIWTFEESRTVEQYCLANIDKMGSEISTMLIRDRVLPEGLRYDQINSRVCATLAAIRAKQEVESITAEEPKPNEEDKTLQIKYDILVNAIIGKARGLMEKYPTTLLLSAWEIDNAIRFCEPDKYAERLVELGGSEIVRRITK